MNQVYFLQTPKGCFLTLKKTKPQYLAKDLIKVVRKPNKKHENNKNSALTIYSNCDEDTNLFLKAISPRLKTLPVYQDSTIYSFQGCKLRQAKNQKMFIQEPFQIAQFIDEPQSNWQQIKMIQKMMHMQVSLAIYNNKNKFNSSEKKKILKKPYYNTRQASKMLH